MRAVPARPRPRVLGAVGLLLAGLVVALLPLPPVTAPAAAADGSAVTKTGTRGTHDDFSRLKVTVHQTANLRSQGVRITWEGGAPTYPGANYLQIMQCWGDAQDGPRREQCVYGSQEQAGGNAVTRTVVAGTAGAGADPAETEYTGADAFVPFRPVGGEPPTTSAFDYTYFGPLDTNEQTLDRTAADGTGEAEFELQDGIEAGHLGCGLNTAAAGAAPAPRPCWLVVVPRGSHDANGTEADPARGTRLQSSPLSTTNWAQRIVFRLDFLPVDDFCPSGGAERPVTGSELATDAVTSWQPKLCTTTDSAFSYDPDSEELARNSVSSTTSQTPLLGVTVDPVAHEEGQPDVVQAPLAVSGLAIGFSVESATSGVLQEMRLTPRLVAKMLTHSYVRTVPFNKSSPTPAHVAGNPYSYFDDPDFKALNPGFADFGRDEQMSGQLSLMVPNGNSDTTRLLWKWLRSDQEARDFLSGKPDPWGMRVNSYFRELDLADDTSRSDFPKNDPTTAIAVDAEDFQWAEDKPTYGVTALDPYTEDLHEAAVRTRRGNNNNKIVFDPQAINKNELKNLAPGGLRTSLAVVDAASAQRYGLKTASLRNADGRFVKPTADTLLAGVGAMRPWPGGTGVLEPDPARAGGQAYPLTAVTYAAASVNQDAKDRKAYADFIRYAAGPGQTPGPAAGELPDGYAPLPADLRKQAVAAAGDLERGAVPEATDGPGSDGAGGGGGGDSAGAGPGGGAGGAAGGTAAAGGSPTGGSGGGTDPSASAPPGGAGGASAGPGAQQNVADAKRGFTPGDVLGIVRWVLLVVLFVGGAAGLAGPVMLRLAQRRTP
ncbi:hypothetical protein AB0F77_01475 [Streptomyces sp. NPDC026672]|uniref:hypothetical protein n=1 Tax=unclassified Streptomyces TaxID=2593676 RepID=UPI0033F0F7B8